MNHNDKSILCQCDNCSWRGDVTECKQIHDLLDRVEAGGEFPAGECPKCGALAYLVSKTDISCHHGIPRVIISVSGGVADIIFKPIGIAISIFDYDTDGAEPVSEDPDGDMCVISNWVSQEKVIPNENWLIARQAKHDVTCHCTKQWKCPSCGHIVECSYEQIVQIGTPHCPRCEIEMAMI